MCELLFYHINKSLSGGWVPGMSKGFHFWQPAPRLNNAFMAGTTLHPSHEPPRTRGKNRHLSHWRTVERKGREGGERDGNCSWPCWLTETPRTAKPTAHEWNTAQWRKCLKTDLWPRVLLALFVVNSFKLHLNTFNFSLIRNWIYERLWVECQVEQRRGGCCEQRNVGVVVMSPARFWAFLVRVDANSQRAERNGASKVLSKFLIIMVKIIIIIIVMIMSFVLSFLLFQWTVGSWQTSRKLSLERWNKFILFYFLALILF